jgi:hypothetical protein
MRAAAIALLGLASCQYDLDACARDHTCHATADAPPPGGPTCEMGTTASCMNAVGQSSLTWIQTNIFTPQCTFSGCHNGATTTAGKVDLRMGKAYTHLVGFASALDTSRKLVVASDPKSSYLELMMGIIKPLDATPPASPPRADVGYMPEDNGGNLLCCQKLDAIDRWISAGAMNN